MCSDRNSGGVNENVDSNNVAVLGTLLAHELGHNIGLMHDDGRSCDCPDSFGCIMASHSGVQPARQFSPCCFDDYGNFLDSGLGGCMLNEPTQLFEPPSCGNGFVEDGEECDCGTTDECADNRCCIDCILAPGAVCVDGVCCEDCQEQLVTVNNIF
ncbi:disintegrin and metalloproteinase domain-containing protein 11-like [Glandiceps talaboti]